MKAFIPFFCFLGLICLGAPSLAPKAAQPNWPALPYLTAASAGFIQDSLNSVYQSLRKDSRKDFRGLVVLKDNHIVVDAYYNTYWRQTIHDVRSVGKSITALLLGVAIKDGLIKDLDQSVYSLFSPEENFINEDYKHITLRHLLDMSSGLDADSDDFRSLGQAGRWMDYDDWKSYLLNIPRKRAPGKKFVYADMHAVLIGLAIEEASGMSLKDYAQEKLFDPLEITQVYWYTNGGNQTGAAGNLYISTIDLAVVGLLLTNEGKWNDQQIIEASYIEEIINRKTFDISNYFNLADSYGMMWYKSKRTFGGREFEYLFASGNGGNHLVVVPSENIVISITSSAYGPGYGQRRSYEVLSRVLGAYKK